MALFPLAFIPTAAGSVVEGGPLVVVLVFIISTLAGLLGWVVRLVITGKLVPGSERDYWREFALEEQRQKREIMVPTAQVVQGVVQALPDAPATGPPASSRCGIAC